MLLMRLPLYDLGFVSFIKLFTVIIVAYRVPLERKRKTLKWTQNMNFCLAREREKLIKNIK